MRKDPVIAHIGRCTNLYLGLTNVDLSSETSVRNMRYDLILLLGMLSTVYEHGTLKPVPLPIETESVLIETRQTLQNCGFVGAGSWGPGDYEVNIIDNLLARIHNERKVQNEDRT